MKWKIIFKDPTEIKTVIKTVKNLISHEILKLNTAW